MPKFLSVLTLVFVSFAMFSAPVEAKRFGGGGSFGKSFPSFNRSSAPRQAPAAPQRQASNPSRQAAPGQRSGASRWLGPLAGLAAGGLIASMLFGDGFEGFQIMDFLVIAGLVFGGMMLLRALRGGARGAPRPGYAGGGSANPSNPFGNGQRFDASAIGAEAFQADNNSGGGSVPAWFDEPGFVEGSKSHFIRLQAAWDAADMRDISEYVTPDMLTELTRERESLGAVSQVTEVITLEAEMMNVIVEDDQLVASVRFSGLIREDADAPANDFSEIWHVVHPAAAPEGDWLIAGIQQV